MTGIPFSMAEEAFGYFDRSGEPQVAETFLGFDHAVDLDRLRVALATAIRTHPMARARKTVGRRGLRPPMWDVLPDEAAVDLAARALTETTLDQPQAEYRSARACTPLPLDAAPGLDIEVLRRPGQGDGLSLRVHHAVGDGIGASRFMDSLRRAYAGWPDPPCAVTLDHARDPGNWLNPKRPRAALQRQRMRTLTGPRVHVAPDGADPAGGFGSITVPLEPDVQAALDPRRFGHAATKNDLYMAATHLAISRWNDAHGAPPGRILASMPMNLRPAEWRNEVLSNVLGQVMVATDPDDRTDPSRLLGTIVAQTTAAKHEPPFGGPSNRRVAGALGWFLRFSKPDHQPTTTFSNVGDLPVLDFGPDLGAPSEHLSGAPTVLPMGLMVAAVKRGPVQTFRIRNHRALLSDDAGRRFSELFVDCVMELGLR